MTTAIDRRESSSTGPARGLRMSPAEPSRGAVAAVPISDVAITDGFWADRQEVNRAATLAHCLEWMERLGWVANFDRAASMRAGSHAGREFADSEVYKLLEAMAWELGRRPDAELERVFDSLARRVLTAQADDGYLNTRFGGPGQPERYSDLEWGHELYCSGHLIQAAVARARVRGVDDPLVRGAVRLADHICREFGAEARNGIDGHAEIETALVELARVTGDHRYTRQAGLFVERRGHGRLVSREVESAYFQDDLPIREATVLRGHAVRALYLAAGALDVAAEDGDESLFEAVQAQWQATLARRTYLTGGMGARHDGEAFGDDFELPNDRAYSETCAGVASAMVAWRLLLATGDLRYGDHIERVLYNVVAASPDRTGTAFFYVNPLQRSVPGIEPEPGEVSPRAASSQRAPWFDVSCCPTNVARLIASLGGYLATTGPDGIQLVQYADAEIATSLPDGRPIGLRIRTDYPLRGEVEVEVVAAPEGEWTLALRVPGWARDAVLHDGVSRQPVGGVARVRRTFRTGDRVRLAFSVEPRLTMPDPRIDADRGCVAVEAGPLVYCLESIDAGIAELARLRVPGGAEPVRGEDDLVRLELSEVAAVESSWPYGQAASEPAGERRTVPLIPYHRWAERGPSTMRVWLPREALS